jgi:GTP:adenosylcobinamide-phosphate guanylyltransferase
MRALVLAAGEGSRLPGPVPKPFRLLGGRPVVGWIIEALEQLDAVDAIDVIIRREHESWARAALGGYACHLIPQTTKGPVSRLIVERQSDEALLVCLGDTIVFPQHRDALELLLEGVQRSAGPPEMIHVLGQERMHRALVNTTPDQIMYEERWDIFDCGTYYIPEGSHLWAIPDGESLMDAIIGSPPPSHFVIMPLAWRPIDIGTPEGWARAELEEGGLR